VLWALALTTNEVAAFDPAGATIRRGVHPANPAWTDLELTALEAALLTEADAAPVPIMLAITHSTPSITEKKRSRRGRE